MAAWALQVRPWRHRSSARCMARQLAQRQLRCDLTCSNQPLSHDVSSCAEPASPPAAAVTVAQGAGPCTYQLCSICCAGLSVVLAFGMLSTCAQAQMEAEVLTVRREMSNEYRRRLDALEAEWATRATSRATELEAAHTLKLQQVRASCRDCPR